MSLAEFLYFLAFTMYIIGACWSLRSDGRKAAVIVLTIGVISDVLVTALAMFGHDQCCKLYAEEEMTSLSFF